MLLVESTGEKGGCGKSIFAQVLASYFKMREWRWRGIDTDPVNQQFGTLGEERVTGINLQASGHWIDAEVEKFGNLVGEAMQSGEVDAIIVDLGAAQLGLIDRALKDIGLDSWIGRGITRVYAYSIVESNQSLTTLANNMTNLDGRQDEHWLIVRNSKDGPLDSYNNGSIVRPHLLSTGAHEIDVEAFPNPSIFKRWAESGQLIDQFITTNPSFAAGSMMATWAMKIYEQLESFVPFQGVKP
jgi:hypothetical protein